MKKIIALVLACIIVIAVCAGCNKQIVDFTYNYNYAIIKMPNGEVVEGKVSSWNDYEGDQLQIVINGTTYLVHSTNVALMHK